MGMKKISKKKVFASVAGIVVILVAVAFLVSFLINKNLSEISDDEIKEKFECNRITLEIRPTDRYCSNPDNYRTDFKNGTVIKV